MGLEIIRNSQIICEGTNKADISIGSSHDICAGTDKTRIIMEKSQFFAGTAKMFVQAQVKQTKQIKQIKQILGNH